MLKDEELLSNFEGNMVVSNHDQKTTNDNSSVVNNGTCEYNSCDTEDGVNSNILVADMIPKTSVAESYISDVLDNAIMINLDQMESNNEKLVFKDKVIKAVNITEDNISHQMCISQQENVGNSVASLPKSSKKMKRSNSSAKTGAHSDMCCKVSIVFGVCFIIGFFLLPLMLYYVNQTGENLRLDPDHSYEQNKSSVKVCCKLYKDTIDIKINFYKQII